MSLNANIICINILILVKVRIEFLSSQIQIKKNYKFYNKNKTNLFLISIYIQAITFLTSPIYLDYLLYILFINIIINNIV